MRLAVALVLLAGCTERNLELEDALDLSVPDLAIATDLARDLARDLAHTCGAPRACSFDGGLGVVSGVCPSTDGLFMVELASNTLRLCGDQIDGSFEITASNYTVLAHALAIDDVEYRRVDDQAVYDDLSKPPLVRPYSCSGEPDPWNGKVVAGAVDTLRIDERFDVPNASPGSYQLRLQLDVDGQAVFFELGNIVLNQGCN